MPWCRAEVSVYLIFWIPGISFMTSRHSDTQHMWHNEYKKCGAQQKCALSRDIVSAADSSELTMVRVYSSCYRKDYFFILSFYDRPCTTPRGPSMHTHGLPQIWIMISFNYINQVAYMWWRNNLLAHGTSSLNAGLHLKVHSLCKSTGSVKWASMAGSEWYSPSIWMLNEGTELQLNIRWGYSIDLLYFDL